MSFDLGILIIRVFFGLAMAAHGAQKLFGWFGGYGLNGTGSFFEGLGFHPGKAFAALAGLGEFGGGLSLAFGFLTPLGVAVVLATMLVAIITVHLHNGFFVMTNGIEVPLLYAAAAIGIAFAGAGEMSLDALLGLTFVSQGPVIAVSLAAGVIGALVTIAQRRKTETQASPAKS